MLNPIKKSVRISEAKKHPVWYSIFDVTLNSQNYDYIGSTSNTNSQCWLEFWVAEDKEESLTLQKKGPDILAAVRFWYQGPENVKTSSIFFVSSFNWCPRGI